jgi:hypothetical protein
LLGRFEVEVCCDEAMIRSVGSEFDGEGVYIRDVVAEAY